MNKNKFDELLEKLSNIKIVQKSIDWTEDIPDDIWDDYFKDNQIIMPEMDVDRHRHYETSICVIKIFDRLLGIQNISNIYSEMSSASDMYHTLKFFEMEEVPSVIYKKK